MLLEGTVEADDPRDTRISELEDELRDLRNELLHAHAATKDAKRDAARALVNLRRQLSPLYRALQDVFGELDAAGTEDTTSAPSRDKWDAWKQRLGPGCAKVIDALLLGNEMTVTAIAVSAHMGKRQVYEATSKMGQAGILARNGSKFSLKPI